MNIVLWIVQIALVSACVRSNVLPAFPYERAKVRGVVHVLCASGSLRSAVVEMLPNEPSIKRLVAQADALYAERANLTRLREAILSLRKGRGVEPTNYEVNWRLAKFSHYLAVHTADKSERDAALSEGSAAGAAAVKARPDEPGGHFWLGANLGERARSQGALKALTLVDDIRWEMEAVIKLDEGYQNGSAYMVLGQVDLSLPSLFGGDKKRAIERLERGLRFGEENAFLRLRLAEAYMAVRRKEDAQKQLSAILAMKPHPDYVPEYEEAVAEARRLLDKRFR